MAALFRVTHEIRRGTNEERLYDVYAVHFGGPFRAMLFIWDFELEKFRWIESSTCKLVTVR